MSAFQKIFCPPAQYFVSPPPPSVVPFPNEIKLCVSSRCFNIATIAQSDNPLGFTDTYYLSREATQFLTYLAYFTLVLLCLALKFVWIPVAKKIFELARWLVAYFASIYTLWHEISTVSLDPHRRRIYPESQTGLIRNPVGEKRLQAPVADPAKLQAAVANPAELRRRDRETHRHLIANGAIRIWATASPPLTKEEIYLKYPAVQGRPLFLIIKTNRGGYLYTADNLGVAPDLTKEKVEEKKALFSLYDTSISVVRIGPFETPALEAATVAEPPASQPVSKMAEGSTSRTAASPITDADVILPASLPEAAQSSASTAAASYISAANIPLPASMQETQTIFSPISAANVPLPGSVPVSQSVSSSGDEDLVITQKLRSAPSGKQEPTPQQDRLRSL
ncbi:MAG: hypothetical protein Q9219_004806 [cf. Caloplaca sp. 3 TL-2023]